MGGDEKSSELSSSQRWVGTARQAWMGVAAATLQSLDMVGLAEAAASVEASEAPVAAAAATVVAPPTVAPPVAEPEGEALEPETKRLKFRLKMPAAEDTGENGKHADE